jgi:hypothetical protein
MNWLLMTAHKQHPLIESTDAINCYPWVYCRGGGKKKYGGKNSLVAVTDTGVRPGVGYKLFIRTEFKQSTGLYDFASGQISMQ